ncbi:MAG: TlyA family RNA methyltransferase [Epsilonproteobacteria bacterium]|nr:TlyA family RNA methyltransferase [Campylobacterota bacterium]
MSKKVKTRLDVLVGQQWPALSRSHIQSLILQGKVTVRGELQTKPGTMLDPEVEITVDLSQDKYVSRAGHKLEAALKAFEVDVNGLVVLDAGISTGGFTDCLLQHGAARVYGVDVGYGQVHEKIRVDQRLVLLERTNLRHLKQLPEKVDLVTLDLSFISILKVMPAVSELLKPGGRIIVLIKPQFEAEREDIGRKGLVRSEQVHERVIEKLREQMPDYGYSLAGLIESPITGAASGNKEFLGMFVSTK